MQHDPSRPDPRLDSAVAEDQRLQADPELQEGRAAPASVAVTLLASFGVIVMVLYGINHRSDHAATGGDGASATAAAPPAVAPPASASNDAAARPLTSNIADQPPAAKRSPEGAQKAQQEPKVTPEQAGQAGIGGQSGENTGAAPKGPGGPPAQP